MRKKYLSALLFGALVFASTGTFTSCKDYDDQINGLQEQIDEINAKAPAITTEDLKTAIDSAIETLKTSLNESVQGNTAEIEKLQGLVDDLNAALDAKADKTAIEGIIADIETLSDKVEGFEGALKECVQLTEFNALKDRVSALEEANKNFLTSADLEAYLTTDEISSLIDNKIAEEIKKQTSDSGEIYKLINEQINAAIASQISGIYVTMEDFNDAISSLNTKLNDYAKQADLTALTDRVEDLEQINVETVLSLVDNKENIDKLIGYIDEIEALINNTAGYLTAATLGDEIEQYLAEALKNNESEFYKLNEALKELGLDIDSLKAMIQSIVYKPEYTDGKVRFSELRYNYFRTEFPYNKTVTLVDNSNDVTVQFRVSPSTAAKDFDKKYEIVLQGDEALKTRATNIPTFDVEVINADAETGIVTLKVAGNGLADGNEYPVCAVIKAKEGEENIDNVTAITSDYFVVEKNVVVADGVTLANVPATDCIYWNKDGDKIDYNVAKLQLTKTGQVVNNIDIYEGWADDFSIEFKEAESNGDYFKMEGNVLTLNSYAASANNMSTVVTAKVKYTADNKAQEIQVSAVNSTVTAKEYFATIAPVKLETVTRSWSKDVQYITVDMNKIYDATGLTLNRFTAFSGTSTADENVKFNIGTDNALVIEIPARQAAGTYTPSVKFENPTTAQEFTVSVDVTIDNSSIADFAFEFDDVLVDKANNNIIFNPAVGDENNHTLKYTYDLSAAVSNFDDLETTVQTLGGIVEYRVKGSDVSYGGITYSNGTLTLNQFSYQTTNPVKVIGKIKFTNHDGSEFVADEFALNVKVENLSGKWTKGTTSYTFATRADEFQLFKGFKWESTKFDNLLLWGDNGTAQAPSFVPNNKLNNFGLFAPKFRFTEETKSVGEKYFELNTTNGTLKLKPGTDAFASDVTVKVEIYWEEYATPRWGAVQNFNGNNIISITVPAGLSI